MSTPINQLKNTANNTNTQSAKMDDDPMVQDVINALVRDVHVSEQVKSTPIATFQQPQQQSPQLSQQQTQQQYHPQHPINNQRNNIYTPNKTLMEEWVDVEDAKRAVCIALIALLMLYPANLSNIYEKFAFLTKFQQYDIFIRAGLLAIILYILLRKFKDIL